jgi:hypothetical protein
MKLKQKFAKASRKCFNGNYYIIPIIEDAEIIEKIADEFAIGFAEWLVIRYNEDIIFDEYTTQELLEIYKKEKRL